MITRLTAYGTYDLYTKAQLLVQLSAFEEDELDDAMLESAIQAASGWVECYVEFPLAEHSYITEYVDNTSDDIQLPQFARNVIVYESDGTTVFDGYGTMPTQQGPLLVPDDVWPEGVIVTFTIAPRPAAAIPATVISAIAMHAHDLVEFRGQVPATKRTAVERILNFHHERY